MLYYVQECPANAAPERAHRTHSVVTSIMHESVLTFLRGFTVENLTARFASLHYLDLMTSAFDLLVVSYLVYQLIMLARGTRAWQVFIGVVFFACIWLVSQWANLITLNYILRQMFLLGPVAIVLLFYPEIRHALEEVGRLGFWGRGFVSLGDDNLTDLVGEIARAASIMASRRTGALIVIERETGLSDIIETGTQLNAVVSVELLNTIFYSGSPLHDGAVIIRGNRIAAAGCTLPLSDSPHIETTIHTRHKAALGISEQSDAAIVVVSEETGIISLAFEGNLVRGLRDEALQQRLTQILKGKERLSLRRRLLAAGGRVTAAPPQTPPPPSSPKPKPAERDEPGPKTRSAALGATTMDKVKRVVPFNFGPRSPRTDKTPPKQ